MKRAKKKLPDLTPAQKKRVDALIERRKKLGDQIEVINLEIGGLTVKTRAWKTQNGGCPT